jgi:hypothetical protein
VSVVWLPAALTGNCDLWPHWGAHTTLAGVPSLASELGSPALIGRGFFLSPSVTPNVTQTLSRAFGASLFVNYFLTSLDVPNLCWGPNTGATRRKRLRVVQFLCKLARKVTKNRELNGMWVACKSAGSATVCSVAAMFQHDRGSSQGPAEAEPVLKRTGNNPVQVVPFAGYDDGLLLLRSHPHLTSGLERLLAGERGSGADRIS